MMKSFALLCSAVAMVSSAFALQPGDSLKVDGVSKATFIQGTAPTEWEPGKLYFIECWATWCGPCIASIPHVNELHQKYKDKGLRVIGMNVWERKELEEVAKFVKGKGEGMSYPVASIARGSEFENEWLKAANVRGIPHAFLVRDGKLLATHHPAQITNELIEKLLAGGDGEKTALAAINKQKADREAETKLFGEFRAAQKEKNVAVMEAKLAEIAKLPSAAQVLPNLKLDLAMAKDDWTEVSRVVSGMADNATAFMPVMMLADRLTSEKGASAPMEVKKAVVEKLIKASGDKGFDFQVALSLASLQWSIDDKEGAKTTVKRINENPKMGATAAVVQKLADAVASGTMPEKREVYGWLTEARKAGAAVAQ